MIATFKSCSLQGSVDAPTSKSMAHRYLIGAALCGERCTLDGIDFSEDIAASIDCLRALGVGITVCNSTVTVDPKEFMKVDKPVLRCRESGSTLRFFIPLSLCLGTKVMLTGSKRLFERPLDVYEQLCLENGFCFEKGEDCVTVCGNLRGGRYTVRGDISSQFITGLLMALVYLGEDASIEIQPPFESRSYVNLTIAALKSFGADVRFFDEYKIDIKSTGLHSFSGRVEGDYSNAAFLDAFNHIGSQVDVRNLDADSLQGDKVYASYFDQITQGTPTLDISDCPDLGPILFALAALKNGAVFTGTDRLKAKESDRGEAMQKELSKLGGTLLVGDNTITVPKQKLAYRGEVIDGHNDHRIVMAMSVILSVTGGTVQGIEAVKKSYPGFFDDLKRLGASVHLA